MRSWRPRHGAGNAEPRSTTPAVPADRFETADPSDLHPTAPLRALADTARRRAQAEADLVERVRECRDAGWPWADIGRALGVNAQAAQQRYGKLVGGGQA